MEQLFRQDRPRTVALHGLCVTVDGAESVNPGQPSDLTAPRHHGTLMRVSTVWYGSTLRDSNQLFYTLFI